MSFSKTLLSSDAQSSSWALLGVVAATASATFVAGYFWGAKNGRGERIDPRSLTLRQYKVCGLLLREQQLNDFSNEQAVLWERKSAELRRREKVVEQKEQRLILVANSNNVAISPSSLENTPTSTNKTSTLSGCLCYTTSNPGVAPPPHVSGVLSAGNSSGSLCPSSPMGLSSCASTSSLVSLNLP